MKQGSVLILTLWALLFLGALAVAVGSRAGGSLKLAEHVKVSSALDGLASAGVQRACAAIRAGNEDTMSGETSEYWSRDNELFEGGTFSVYNVSAVDGSVVTNYGVICESSKTNINNMSQISSLLEGFAGKSEAVTLSDSIREYRKAKKLLTQATVKGKFQSIHELLLVDGVTYELFEALMPHITIYDSDCYGGTASGYLGEGEQRRSRSVRFVFNRKLGRIVYWDQ